MGGSGGNGTLVCNNPSPMYLGGNQILTTNPHMILARDPTLALFSASHSFGLGNTS
jgi:hypothetical protein